MQDDRPTGFDDRVMQYLPGLKKRAWKFARSREDRQDLVTDTIMYALSNWKSFNEEGGFWLWLTWCMRSVVSNKWQAATAEKRQGRTVSIDHAGGLSTPAQQSTRVDAQSVLQALDLIKNGDLLLRHAMGEDAAVLAAERNCSKSRIHQINQEVRAKLERFV